MSKLSNSDDNLAVGERLAAVREDQRLSQIEFAERLGLSPRAYQNYERGERELPAAVLTTLHAVFGLDPLWVLIGPGRDPRKAGASVKPDILEAVIIGVESHLQRTHKKLAPAKKARLIKVLYLQFRDRAKVDPAQMADVLSLTA
ncbi:helix-turn-helix transcriptional regulator [Pseudoxanthomonas sp. SE1]|uniref:helix-turn-helix domain-containing protein n=1 Tax=Pseudoxanthomonas sp. SE1 TaxID=1664560 RepID=UPI00240D3604|nr:helix-turn-helix transcriptional regulator [Pseudoxanthomonas sp. SE1]WFC42301.1 helix-turn-helix transcriptional regulator [Pseudoxanthomonas sp. SE1]